MLILPDRNTFNDIKKLALGSLLPVISIIVAPNPDAIAASKVLTVCYGQRHNACFNLSLICGAFQDDAAKRRYSIHAPPSPRLWRPCRNSTWRNQQGGGNQILFLLRVPTHFTFLHVCFKHNHCHMTYNKVRGLFLINCGALVNLAELLELSETTVQVYVLDSHRPFNLRNVYHRQVRISRAFVILCACCM